MTTFLLRRNIKRRLFNSPLMLNSLIDSTKYCISTTFLNKGIATPFNRKPLSCNIISCENKNLFFFFFYKLNNNLGKYKHKI